MKKEDYELLTSDGGEYPTIGFCPFCGKPGWITGDDDWCEHYIGASNCRSAAGPLGVSVFSKIEEMPISKQLQKRMEKLRGITPEQLKGTLKNVSGEFREYIREAIENDWMSAAFLDFYHEFKFLECTYDSCLSEESCTAFFVLDLKIIKDFHNRILTSIIRDLKKGL